MVAALGSAADCTAVVCSAGTWFFDAATVVAPGVAVCSASVGFSVNHATTAMATTATMLVATNQPRPVDGAGAVCSAASSSANGTVRCVLPATGTVAPSPLSSPSSRMSTPAMEVAAALTASVAASWSTAPATTRRRQAATDWGRSAGANASARSMAWRKAGEYPSSVSSAQAW